MITRLLHTASDQDEKAKQWFIEKISPFLNPPNIFKSDNPREHAMIRIIMQKFPEWPEVQEYQKILDLINDPKNIQYITNPISIELFDLLQRKNGEVLKFIPREYITPELCRSAVEFSGYSLQLVPEELKTKELCEIAVKDIGYMIKFVPESIITSELCEIAVKSMPSSLFFVPEELKTLELCELAVSQSRHTFEFVPNHLKKQIKKKFNL